MWHLWIVLAQQEGGKTGSGGPPEVLQMLLFLLPLIVLFFWMSRQGQKRQEQERATLLAGLKKNDRVLTSSGIYGTIVAISEKEDELTLRVDDNVRLKMVKASIARNLSNEEAVKAEKAAKEGKKA
jgi:preprotein translocase subunit YajC